MLIGHEDYSDLQDGVWQTVCRWRFQLWWSALRGKTPPDDWTRLTDGIRELARRKLAEVDASTDLAEPGPLPELHWPPEVEGAL